MWTKIKEASEKLLQLAFRRDGPPNTLESDDTATKTETTGPVDPESSKEQKFSVKSDSGIALSVLDVDHQDDNQSQLSGSTTPNSTSTYEYSHETYETYQYKIKDLVSDIGGRDLQLLDRIRGGSSNRIVALKFTVDARPDPIVGVLRIPRFPWVDDDDKAAAGEEAIPTDTYVLDQISILQFVGSYSFPVPKVLAFDSTVRNAVKSPYTLMEYARGERLDELYPRLSYDERRGIIDQLVDLLVEFDHIQFTSCGRLCRGKEQDQLRLRPGDQPVTRDSVHPIRPLSSLIDIKGLGTDQNHNAKPTRPTKTLQGLLTEQFEELLGEEGKDNPKGESVVVPIIEKLLSIMRDMASMNFFSQISSQNVLYHGDLEARNLIVASDGESIGPKLKAVIDWDDTLSLPQILTRRPPKWIWDTAKYYPGQGSIPSDYDSDYDLLDPHRYDEDNGRLSIKDQAMKTYFEQAFVNKVSQHIPGYNMEVYQDEAYGRGHWLRRLARFSMNGFCNSWELSRFKRFAREWDEFRRVTSKE
ncbi:hypothetical protein MMC10_005708 [Thelotrema lepadinum]|nr:hypothetical protein [Thelotrema lepadinum]